MGIQVQWDNSQHTIVRYDFDPHWTSEDFFDAIVADDELITSVDHPVHLIFDMRKSDTVPVVQLTRLRKIAGSLNEQTGLIVLVGANMWINALADIFQKVYASRISHFSGLIHAKTLEEARQRIVAYEEEQQQSV